jgi:ABC-type branched-subunit amino acid transport system substrate-binding protein
MGIMRHHATGAQRRSFIALGLLAVIAACAAPQRKAPPAPPPPPIEVKPQLPTLPEGPPQHKVAVLVPVSGGNAAVGQSIANAANMALLESGDKRIKLTVYNTATGASAAAAKAIAEGNKVILGPLLSGDVTAIEPQAKAAGVPIISFSNDSSVVGDGTYILGFQPAQSVARVVGYARSRGVERFAALIPAGTYGQRASSAFVKAVQASGGKVTAIETFPRDRAKLVAAVRRVTDYETRVAKAAQAGMVRQDGSIAPVQSRLAPVGFQALLIADSGAVAAAFGPALAQYGAGPAQVRILGPELWNAEPGIAARPALAGAWFAAVPDTRFQQLATRYRAKFGGQPSRLASLGYDAVLLVNSIAGRWQIGTPFPRAALGEDEGFAGVDGIFRFRGGVAERGLEVQQVGGGGFTTVSAAPRSFSE